MGNKPIVHAPIATGSTEPRDIRDRFADFVNLKDFGAAGDGITNDTAAWTAWRTAFQNGGMPYIPKGNYLLGEEIVHAPKGHFGVFMPTASFEDGGPVLEEFYSHLYVDAVNGDDSNDGLSFSTALKTISKAVNFRNVIAGSAPFAVIHIAGGTYTENIKLYNKSFNFKLHGNVTLNGYIHIIDRSSVVLTNAYNANNANYSLSVNTSTAEHCIVVSNHSWFYNAVNINVTETTNIATAVVIKFNSYAYCNYLDISGSTLGVGLLVNTHSCFIANELYCDQTSSSVAAGCLINAELGSYICVNGSCSIRTNTQTTIAVLIRTGSIGIFEGSENYVRVNHSDGIQFFAQGNSSLRIANCIFDCSTSCQTAIRADEASFIRCGDIINALGTYTLAFLAIADNSTFILPSTATVVNNAAGSRYIVSTYSLIRVYSTGPNRLPGGTAGITDSGGVYL